MIKVKVFKKVGQRLQSRSHILVLSKGIHMWNMKALPATVEKLWRLKFSKCRSNVTMSKNLIQTEMYFQKEYTCEIWKSYLSQFKSYDQWKFSKSRSRSKTLVLTERSCHKECTCEIWMHTWNNKALRVTVQKLWPWLKFLWWTDRQMRFNSPHAFAKNGGL